MTYLAGDHITTLVTAATVLPVSLADMKEHLRVDAADEDMLINSYIVAATTSLDAKGELGKAIITQTWDEAFQYPARDVYLSILPAASLTSVTYYDTSNAQQTATLSEFTLYKSDDWAFVRSENWPTAYDRPDAITLQYVAGAATVSANIQHAIKLMVGHWYQNREDASEVNLKEIPRAAAHLIGLSRGAWYG